MEGAGAAASGRGRVQVFARVRPANSQEDGFVAAVEPNDETKTVRVRNEGDAVDRVLSGQAADAALASAEMKDYAFDGVFAPSSAQKDVFLQMGLPVLRECLKGFNGTILAYGQTGSGKTHSLLHQGQKSDDAGLLPRLVASLFVLAAQDSANVYEIEAAAVQVYNEQVDDLLHADHQSGGGQNLTVNNGGNVPNLTWIKCRKPDSMLEAFTRARANVVYAETKMNKASSRSHAIFQVRITKRARADEAAANGGGPKRMEVTQARLNVVDLAGSERVKKSGVQGAQFKEATNINKSLLAFGNVVSALAAKKQHVPLRDSKLTRILEGSIGGNCKTALLVCTSPAAENVQETINTLDFASRAMRVEVDAKVNTCMVEVSAKALFADLSSDVEQLGGIPGAELEALRRKSSEAAEKAKAEAQRREKAAAEAEAQQQVLQKAKTDAEQKSKKLQEEAESLRQSQQTFVGEAARLKDAVAAAENLAAEWKEKAEGSAKEAEQAKKAAEKEVQQLRKASEKEAERLQKSVEEWKAKADAKAKEVASLHVAKAVVETKVATAQKEVDTAGRLQTEELTSARLQIEEASKRAAAATARAAAAEGAVEEAQAHARAVEAQLQGLQDEVRLQKESTEEQTSAERRKASAALQAAAAEAEGLREQAENLRDRVEEVSQQAESLSSELAARTEELHARTAALNQASVALEELRLEADKRESRLRDELAAQLESSRETHCAEVAHLEAQLARACAEATATLAEERATHAAKAEALEAQMAHEAAQWADERAQIEAAHLATADAQREEFQTRLKDSKEQFEARIAEMEDGFKAEKGELSKRLEEKEAELKKSEDQWRDTKEQAVREAWEEGTAQQRRLAAAFKAARCISTMKEEELRAQHDDLSKRFASRESREEDVRAISEQKRLLSQQTRSLKQHERTVQGLALELSNRDATDRIFGGTGAERRQYRPSSRGPSIGGLAGKKLGDHTKNYSERRRALSQSASMEMPPTAKNLLSATVNAATVTVG